MKNIYINIGDPILKMKHSIIEQKYNAKYICDLELNNHVSAIFYQYDLPNPNYSHYFGMFLHNSQIFITSGKILEDIKINGILQLSTNEVIFSRHRHDFRSTKDGKISIDGGLDYTHLMWDDDEEFKEVKLIFNEDKLEVI